MDFSTWTISRSSKVNLLSSSEEDSFVQSTRCNRSRTCLTKPGNTNFQRQPSHMAMRCLRRLTSQRPRSERQKPLSLSGVFFRPRTRQASQACGALPIAQQLDIVRSAGRWYVFGVNVVIRSEHGSERIRWSTQCRSEVVGAQLPRIIHAIGIPATFLTTTQEPGIVTTA